MLGTKWMEERATLFGKMLRRLNVDLENACHQALGTTMQRVVRTCSICRFTEPCAAWLATDNDPQGYRTFCPNAEALSRLPKRNPAGLA